MSIKVTNKILHNRRHARVRSHISGTQKRPRLSVYTSNKFVSAQIIDDTTGNTIVSAHGREFGGPKVSQATNVGDAIATRAKKAGVTTIVFDRGGYKYAARVKALATAARTGGLIF